MYELARQRRAAQKTEGTKSSKEFAVEKNAEKRPKNRARRAEQE